MYAIIIYCIYLREMNIFVQPGEWLQGLTREDTELLLQLGTLPVHDILNEVRQLQNLAYQLGQEETKEMTR